MPRVKNPKTGKVQHFPYTPAGEKAAAAAKKKLGGAGKGGKKK